jgi:hypothetical protein
MAGGAAGMGGMGHGMAPQSGGAVKKKGYKPSDKKKLGKAVRGWISKAKNRSSGEEL